MANAIWNGVISFGLLNIPVALHSGERSTDLHFRMLDSRDNSPIRFERVNAETGEEVPWKQIVKAFEYEKGNYVVLEQEDFKAAAPDSLETVEVTSFVDRESIQPMYYEKPYYLVPGKKAEKGYVLLREVLRKTNRVAMGKVVIRTREYLCGLLPIDNALVMMLLRFPQEIVPAESFKLPGGGLSEYRISSREVAMAEELVESMSIEFEPTAYVDDFRTRLQEVIDTRIRSQEGTVTTAEEGDEEAEQPSTNVVDFMALLRKSLKGKSSDKETAAKKTSKTRSRDSTPSTAGAKGASKSASGNGSKTASKSGSKAGLKAGSKGGSKTASTGASKGGSRTAAATGSKAGSKAGKTSKTAKGTKTARRTGSKTASKVARKRAA